MNEHESPRSLDDADREQLIAYLDGELDGESSRRVESRLSDDADYRRALAQLQNAWEMLDHLPRAEVDEQFTHSTVEMVAVTAGGDVEKERSAALRRRAFGYMAGALALAGAGLAGFLAVALVVDQPNQRLVRDLPVVENIDYYRHVEDIEFLRRLAGEGLFVEETPDAP
jgi:anti-sigma factor RsiW